MLDRIELEVGDGEYLVLVGPSGSGKTTLLRLIAGLEVPDAGRLCIDGRDQATVDPADRGVGLVFQGHALFPHLTARENLALPLRLRRLADGQIYKQVNAIGASMGLTGHLDRLPEHLSGGERQRVALGRALIGGSQILLLDEPLSNLDPEVRAQLRGELRRVATRHRLTVLHVTHDQREALSLGDRIAVLRGGCLQQTGTPRELYHRPANPFVARFLGDPPMNLWRLPDGSWCGVRPEHLAWKPEGSPVVTGVVARTEFNGRDGWVVVDHPDGDIFCAPPTEGPAPKIGSVVQLYAAPAHQHLFPATSINPAHAA